MIDFFICRLCIFRTLNGKIMKTQLIRIVEAACDLAKSLLDFLADVLKAVRDCLKRLNYTLLGKIVLVTAVIAALGYGIIEGYYWYKERHSRYYYYEKQLSDKVETHFFRDDMTRVYNMETGKYTTPRLDWVAEAPIRDSLTVFCRKDKRGFLNVNNGQIVIEAQYDKAWVFSEGVGAVVQDNKIGFVNARNEVVIPFRYIISDRNGWDLDYIFINGCCVMSNERGACGIIDKEGNWIIEPEYDCIWTPHGDGYRVVKDGDKYGLLNPALEFVYPIEYDYIDFATNDAGILLTQNGRRWQVDFDGNVTRPFVVDYTNWIYVPETYDEEDGSSKLSDYIEYHVDSYIGVLRRDNGQIVIPAIYKEINMLSETLFEAQLHYDGDWILIDTDGNIISND